MMLHACYCSLHFCSTINKTNWLLSYDYGDDDYAGAPGRTVLRTDGVLLGKYDIINK